jgi:hypothetical protein
MFITGLIFGLFIELFLGLIIRTQFWENASFFGIPYWLPIVWGYGFIVIYKIGDFIVYKLN